MATKNTAIGGFVVTGFGAVADAFRRNLDDLDDVGAAFAVVKDGELVVDLWGGLADRATGRPWQEDTLQVIWSGTKGLTAACTALLVDRGLLDIDAPVARYWPAFQHGRPDILVRHVLSHTAGLPGIAAAVSESEMLDHALMIGYLETQTPLWPAGERYSYHGLTVGWLSDELVRRTDGRRVAQFFADEFAKPLGLEAWIGLPAEYEPKVSVMHYWDKWSTPEIPPAPPLDRLFLWPKLGPNHPNPYNTVAYHQGEIRPATRS